MKYLVVIDANSLIGKAYAPKNLAVAVGPETHVGLHCIAIDLSNPQYIFVQTDPNQPPGIRQSLHLPHGIVVMIAQYEVGDPPAIGFAPERR